MERGLLEKAWTAEEEMPAAVPGSYAKRRWCIRWGYVADVAADVLRMIHDVEEAGRELELLLSVTFTDFAIVISTSSMGFNWPVLRPPLGSEPFGASM